VRLEGVLTADALITACRADIRPAADAAFATLPPHLTGAVRDTTIAERAEIPIYCPGGLVDTTPARPSLRHLRQNHHRLTDTGPWARTVKADGTIHSYSVAFAVACVLILRSGKPEPAQRYT
jgi:hypothetical protein